MNCPPINHKKFKIEFIRRNCPAENSKSEQCLLKINDSSDKKEYKFTSYGSRLLWIILHPIQVYELIRECYMVDGFYVIMQIFYILFLVHLSTKAFIYAFFIKEDDKEMMKYLDSIYYPHVAGVSTKPNLFNFLFLGHSLFFLIIKLMRFCGAIAFSLRNANEYNDLRICQLNSAYLSTFYFNLKDWLKLWDYVDNHEKGFHSNRDTQVSHLEFNNLIQRTLSRLPEKDAMFYVNPIDFNKCYENSILANYRKQSNSDWHVPYPTERISVSGLREIFMVTILGSSSILFGTVMSTFVVIYLELRSELLKLHYSPTFQEIILIALYHWSYLKHWIRAAESIMMIFTLFFCILDLACAYVDVHVVTGRVHRIAQIFEHYLEFPRRYMKQIDQMHPYWRLIEEQNVELFQRLTYLQGENSHDNGDHYKILTNYNEQTRRDIVLIRLIHREFLYIRRHHTQFFNLFVLGEGVCIAYITPVVASLQLCAETFILVAALISSILPIIAIFIFCARLERTVSSLLIIYGLIAYNYSS